MKGDHGRYRADIAGLRAIAVVPIVLFHAGFVQIRGGFTGVDVFFVISGFLITGVIMRDMAAGQFRISDFYRRRIVRLLPALVATLIATMLFACLGVVLILPAELRGLAESVAATAAFVSNAYFFWTADYFAPASEARLLLHTWSLGVEEQFYLGFPLFLLALRRWQRWVVPAVLAGTIASFAGAVWVLHKQPPFAFYMLPSRAWELGLGVLAGLGALPRVPSAALRNLLGACGIASILLGVLLIQPGRGFPAPFGLLPCAGAALAIGYGEEGVCGRLLALKPMRFLGAISYSLYLWHWPIITFYRLWSGTPVTLAASTVLVMLSVIVATLSHRLIEQPFLHRHNGARSATVIVAGAGAIAVMLVASGLLYAAADHIPQMTPHVRQVAAYLDYPESPSWRRQFRGHRCFVERGDRFDPACLRSDVSKRNVIVLGDSHAAQYADAIADRFPALNVLQATANGCHPLLGGKGTSWCTTLMKRVLDAGGIVDRGIVQAVILGGRWEARDTALIGPTVRSLVARHVAVIVIGPGIEYQQSMPALLARAMATNRLDSLDAERSPGLEAQGRIIARAVRGAGGRYFDAFQVQCPAGACPLFAGDGGPFLFDTDHVTLAASRQVVAHLPAP